MSLKFYLRSKTGEISSLDIIIRHKGERIKIPAGISVEIKYWDQARQRAKENYKYPDGLYVNEAIEKIEKIVKDIYNSYIAELIIPDKDEFKYKIRLKIDELNDRTVNHGIFLDFVKEVSNEFSVNKGKETVKSYNQLIEKLSDYEDDRHKKLIFNDINISFYNDFQEWFYKQKYSANYFGKMIKIIKMFMNEAIERGITDCRGHMHKGFTKTIVESENIYLTVDELLKIYNLNLACFPAGKFKTYEAVKYKFLIGAFTGLRVSDFNRLEDINITEGFLKIKTQKTNQKVVVPVHWVIKEIIESGFDIATKISDQKINLHIKEICREAKINEDVLINESVAGKNVAKKYKKYELVSTHTARRSGATNMYIAGIPTLSIMKITGHKTEKAFLKYIKISEEENAEMLAKHEFFNKQQLTKTQS